jgi:hypothetical protein
MAVQPVFGSVPTCGWRLTTELRRALPVVCPRSHPAAPLAGASRLTYITFEPLMLMLPCASIVPTCVVVYVTLNLTPDWLPLLPLIAFQLSKALLRQLNSA